MMTDGEAEKLLQAVEAFLQKERELYGDFTIEMPTVETNGSVLPPEQKKYYPSDEQYSDPVYSKIAHCGSLDKLKQLCMQADVLQTDLDDTKLVFGGGNPRADLMLVGEAPGAEEDKTGKHFVGRAGKLLDKILQAIDFSREDIYIGNILKHRPPNNRNPLAEERIRSLPFLLRQIDLVQPKLILALGKVAAQTLLDSSETLTNMRGTFYAFRGTELLVTYHPAALLRNPNWKRPTWEDVQKLRERYDELGGRP